MASPWSGPSFLEFAESFSRSSSVENGGGADLVGLERSYNEMIHGGSYATWVLQNGIGQCDGDDGMQSLAECFDAYLMKVGACEVDEEESRGGDRTQPVRDECEWEMADGDTNTNFGASDGKGNAGNALLGLAGVIMRTDEIKTDAFLGRPPDARTRRQLAISGFEHGLEVSGSLINLLWRGLGLGSGRVARFENQLKGSVDAIGAMMEAWARTSDARISSLRNGVDVSVARLLLFGRQRTLKEMKTIPDATARWPQQWKKPSALVSSEMRNYWHFMERTKFGKTTPSSRDRREMMRWGGRAEDGSPSEEFPSADEALPTADAKIRVGGGEALNFELRKLEGPLAKQIRDLKFGTSPATEQLKGGRGEPRDKVRKAVEQAFAPSFAKIESAWPFFKAYWVGLLEGLRTRRKSFLFTTRVSDEVIHNRVQKVVLSLHNALKPAGVSTRKTAPGTATGTATRSPWQSRAPFLEAVRWAKSGCDQDRRVVLLMPESTEDDPYAANHLDDRLLNHFALDRGCTVHSAVGRAFEYDPDARTLIPKDSDAHGFRILGKEEKCARVTNAVGKGFTFITIVNVGDLRR